MIIGISGYMGAGKDTVAQIIQDLTKPFPDSESPWQVKKFAFKLKQIASILTGIPMEKFEDREFKKTKLSSEWGEMTVREFLQRLGTEAVRNGLHPEAWVNALLADYKPVGVNESGVFEFRINGETIRHKPDPIVDRELFPKWIITDTRFPNEADAVKRNGGVILRVNRPFQPRPGETVELKTGISWTRVTYTHTDEEGQFWGSDSDQVNLHSDRIRKAGLHRSETGLDDWPFDYIIENDSTIEALTGRVKEFLLKYNLLPNVRVFPTKVPQQA